MTATAHTFKLTPRDEENIRAILAAQPELAGNATAAVRLALEEAAKKRRRRG